MMRAERMAALLRTTDTPIAGELLVRWDRVILISRRASSIVASGVTPSRYRAMLLAFCWVR